MIDDENNIFVELTLTDSCNCRCSYCFEGDHCSGKAVSNPVEEEKQLKMVVDYCQQFDATKHKWLTLSFWGGEPFVNLQFMKKIIEHTIGYPFVRYHCYSNGTLTEKYRELLSQLYADELKTDGRFAVQLSYDGEPQHSTKRGYSAEKVFETADFLKLHGVPFSFKSALSFDMIKNLPEIWMSFRFLHDRYPDAHVRYSPTLDTTQTHIEYLDDWKTSLRRVAKLEFQFIKEHGYPLWSWFSEGRKSICKLKDTCLIHTDGKVYVCHGGPWAKCRNVVIGTSEMSLDEILSKTNDSDAISENCMKCSATQCAICHVTQLEENDNVLEGWAMKRVNDSARCRYFKEFGYVSRLLKYAEMKTGTFVV